jgi:hypothetical protein
MLYFLGLSILQNGKLPQFLSDKIIHDIFVAEEKSQCVKYLIQGFEKFGIFQVDFNHLIFKIIINLQKFSIIIFYS